MAAPDLSTLPDLRHSIDNIDAAIVHLLAERFRCTHAVGLLKAQHDLPPKDPAREAAQIATLQQIAVASRLDPDFAERFHAFVVKEVIRQHESLPRQSADEVPAH